ncbi:hypothetical protein [Bradyrhizobium sp. 159]|uniref:hypothetical protein n=1 Tax=Bradyrhizobium sp. 159 TaxID=2782632 RepID=UPI001FFAE6FC|nr:hypothetical protein [Bradyrhizobium sp. 159]
MMMIDCAALVTHRGSLRSAPARPIAASPARGGGALDLAMRQRSYFRPAMQALPRLLGEARPRQRAKEPTGYDPSPARRSRFAA